MSNTNTYLVIGGTGRIGREVVREVVERGVTPRALIRHEGRAEALPAGAEPVVGDLGDRGSLERALDGADGVFFVTPHHEHELQWGMNVLEACRAAGTPRVVFSSAPHPQSEDPAQMEAILSAVGQRLAHYKDKIEVERQVRALDVDWNVLLPSNFYQNDAMFRDEILAGSYPQPLGPKGANRVDCRDIGAAGARALLGELPTGGYPVYGPSTWNGPDSAAAWSDVLGRPVSYAGDDLDAWKEAVGDAMSPKEVSDFGKTYQVIQAHGHSADPADIALSERAVGHAPTPYRDYIAHQIEQWG